MSGQFGAHTGKDGHVENPLKDAPETLNWDSCEGWKIQLEVASAKELPELMTTLSHKAHVKDYGWHRTLIPHRAPPQRGRACDRAARLRPARNVPQQRS